MSKTLAKLLCVAALTALAIPAFVQAADTKSPDQVVQGTTPGATSPSGAAGPAITPEEKAARAACDAKSGPDKDKCLKDVDAKFAKSPGSDMGTKPADPTKSGSTK